jgi:Short C-terminal domain
MSEPGPGDLDQDASAVPPSPVIRPGERWSGIPFLLARGTKHSLGWQYWPEDDGGPSYVIARLPVFGGEKILERYPLTEDGWAAAWRALEKIDLPAAVKARKVAIQRHAKDSAESDRGRLDQQSLSVVPGLVFIGGYIRGVELVPGNACDLRFLRDSAAIYLPGQLSSIGEIPFTEIENVEIGGPGLVRSGPRWVGGGSGVLGAAEGIAMAALLSALTTRTTITTIMLVQATRAELFLLNKKTSPQAFRIQLSPVLGSIREARTLVPAPAQETAGNLSPVDELAKLASLLDRGLLTRAEFDELKAKLITGL